MLPLASWPSAAPTITVLLPLPAAMFSVVDAASVGT